MKREWKLIFGILKYIESSKTNGEPIPLPELDGWNRDEIKYHVKLCEQAGYIEACMADGEPLEIICLTWDGHDQLEALRKKGCRK